jgi:hypothetical protein
MRLGSERSAKVLLVLAQRRSRSPANAIIRSSAILPVMALIGNGDGTLWIDINEMNQVDEVQAKLVALGVQVSAVIPDAGCEVIVKEVQWSDVCPKIVPRNGPEPGIVVDPTQIPDGHALVLAVQPLIGPDRDPETVIVLYLIEGPPPSRVGRIVGRPLPPIPRGLRRAKPPPAM